MRLKLNLIIWLISDNAIWTFGGGSTIPYNELSSTIVIFECDEGHYSDGLSVCKICPIGYESNVTKRVVWYFEETDMAL